MGMGFPDLDLGLPDTVSVDIAGVHCAVQSSNFTHLKCITGKALEPSQRPQPIDGLYPGVLALARPHAFLSCLRASLCISLWWSCGWQVSRHATGLLLSGWVYAR
jgi:hypothetical protein